jgi:hypothetical protein
MEADKISLFLGGGIQQEHSNKENEVKLWQKPRQNLALLLSCPLLLFSLYTLKGKNGEVLMSDMSLIPKRWHPYFGVFS